MFSTFYMLNDSERTEQSICLFLQKFIAVLVMIAIV